MSTNKYFITTRKIPTYIKYLISKKGGQTVHEVTSTTGIFYTDMIAPLKRLLVSFEPIQTGSGTPSPTNVRLISGYDSVDVIVSSPASDGNTYTTALGRKVYGGTLDVVSGLLTVDRVKEKFVFDNSTEDSTYNLESQRFTLAQRSTGAAIATNKITNVCGNYAYAQASWQDGKPHFYIGATSCTIYLSKNAYRGGEIEVCYPLETPITYQLIPQQINTLKGINVVTIDGGNLVELVYLTHTL